MPDMTQPTWTERMAKELADSSGDAQMKPGLIAAVLESAGEMKCVRLKTLLSQCHTALYAAIEEGGVPTIRNGLLDEILEALK